MTAACTLPASPQVTVSTTAMAVPLDTRPSYTLRAVPDGKRCAWLRAFMVYEAQPDPDRFEQHAELCRSVPGGTFRHGKVFAAPVGEPLYKYYASGSSRTRDAFKAAARTPEFMETGKDANGDGCSASTSTSRRGVSRSPTSRARFARRARLRQDRLREGAAARDDHAQPPRRPQRVRLPHAARAGPRVRGRVVGRRGARGRRDGHRPRVLRRGRPQGVGGRSLVGNPGSTGSGSAPSRTCTTGCARSASRPSRA